MYNRPLSAATHLLSLLPRPVCWLAADVPRVARPGAPRHAALRRRPEGVHDVSGVQGPVHQQHALGERQPPGRHASDARRGALASCRSDAIPALRWLPSFTPVQGHREIVWQTLRSFGYRYAVPPVTDASGPHPLATIKLTFPAEWAEAWPEADDASLTLLGASAWPTRMRAAAGVLQHMMIDVRLPRFGRCRHAWQRCKCGFVSHARLPAPQQPHCGQRRLGN